MKIFFSFPTISLDESAISIATITLALKKFFEMVIHIGAVSRLVSQLQKRFMRLGFFRSRTNVFVTHSLHVEFGGDLWPEVFDRSSELKSA